MLPIWLIEPNPLVYLSNNFVVLDWETTNVEKGNPRLKENRIVLGSYWLGSKHPDYTGKTKTIHGGELKQEEIVQAILKADFLVAQNTKFELKWLTRCGLDIAKVLCYDTIIGEYVLDGNRISARDLGSIADRYGLDSKESLVDKMIKRGICPSEISTGLLQRYCERDVWLTRSIFLKQRQKLRATGLLPVAYTRNIFTPVLADIELAGIYLDKERVLEFYTEYSTELSQIENELNKLASINWSSTQQVAVFVYETLGFKELLDRDGKPIRNKPNKRFPNGAPVVSSETLLNLVPETEQQRLFIDLKRRHSKLTKALSTYLFPFKDACEKQEGYLFSNFNQAVTATHRLSSNKPNFQNFDRGFKKLFTSRNRDNGGKIGERDAAQLEFRVAAFLGKDPVARKSIQDKEDVHAFTAETIYGKEWNKVKNDKENKKREAIRTASKAHTFKPLFGGTSGTPAEKKYYAAFKEKYKGIAEEQDLWVQEAVIDKKYKMCTGLVFYYPDVKMTRSGYIEGNTNVRNYPIQNLATAEIIPIGVTFLWHYLRDMKMNTFIINTVHDSIITEEDPLETEKINEVTTNIFETDVMRYLKQVYGIIFDIPLEIDTKVKPNWGYEWEQ